MSLRRRARWDGTTGPPPSGNGASSFHLTWNLPRPDPTDPWVGVDAVLEVLEPPSVPALHFWALQASFADLGRHGGAAHLGLQWYPAHPGSTAVNWGGYAADGRELEGSVSPLASATGNVNTRDLAWRTSTPYRLRIERAGNEVRPPRPGLTAWLGQVTDLTSGATTVVRELWAAGDALDAPVVWSEVFARCDDPTSSVRWSALRLVSRSGAGHDVDAVSVNYQSLGEGGCATTDVVADDLGLRQTTGTARSTPPGARLEVPRREG